MKTQFENLDMIARLTHIPHKDIYNIYSYGSRVYGTASYNSDYDYIVIANTEKSGQQFDLHDKSVSCTVYHFENWQEMLVQQKIFALECQFLSDEFKIYGNLKYDFTIDRSLLRKEISSKIVIVGLNVKRNLK